MQMSGYIEAAGTKFRNTEAGNAVAKVSKAKPVKRATAEKALEEFLTRVRTVNLETGYLYAVERVAIFGPYFEGAEKIRHVDIAVELAPKERNNAKLEEREKKQVEEAERQGKRFKGYADRRAWGQNKVLEYLKGKSRTLVLHSLKKKEVPARIYKVVYSRDAAGHC